MSKCTITTDDNTCEVQDSEPVFIEVVVREPRPTPRSSICRLFDKCRHLKTDEWISEFRQLHPECF